MAADLVFGAPLQPRIETKKKPNKLPRFQRLLRIVCFWKSQFALAVSFWVQNACKNNDFEHAAHESMAYTQSIRKDATNYTFCNFALFLQALCPLFRAMWDETAHQPDCPPDRSQGPQWHNFLQFCIVFTRIIAICLRHGPWQTKSSSARPPHPHGKVDIMLVKTIQNCTKYHLGNVQAADRGAPCYRTPPLTSILKITVRAWILYDWIAELHVLPNWPAWQCLCPPGQSRAGPAGPVGGRWAGGRRKYIQ